VPDLMSMLGYIDHLSLLFVQVFKGNLTRGDVSSHHINSFFFVRGIKDPESHCNSVAFTPGKMLLVIDYGILYNYLWCKIRMWSR
jgi:hypothetical protein